MQVCKTVSEVRAIIEGWKRKDLSLGFVPTMGYLHGGHRSLIDRSVRQNDRTIVSIFVNPIQFGPGEDLESYPRDLNADTRLCEEAGADLIFAPSPEEMYPESVLTTVDVSELGNHLCGASRPGHFRGVCTVVTKLFHIIDPNRAYFGQKDIQQLMILKRMTRDLNFCTQIISCPTVREADGLAMSSRNSYLDAEQRKQATVLFAGLKKAEQALKNKERDCYVLKSLIAQTIGEAKNATIDYVEAVDPERLEPLERVNGGVILAVAVKFGKTRLIDNLFYEE